MSDLPAVISSSTADALIQPWRRELELRVGARQLSPTTARTYSIGLRKFMEWVDYHGSMSDDLVLRWIGDLHAGGYSPAAINTWLAGVRAFCKWARRKGLIPFDPTQGLKTAQRQGASRRHSREQLTDREMRRVLDARDDSPAGRRRRAILMLMAYTAARQVEIYNADLADLTTREGRLVLAVLGKGRTEKDELLVITHPEAETALHDWLAVRGPAPGPLFTSFSPRNRGGRLSLSEIRRLVMREFRAAGVRGDKKTTHSLRHTAITSAIRHGAPIEKVKAMARHASLETTMIYWHETDRVANPAEQFIDYGESGTREPPPG